MVKNWHKSSFSDEKRILKGCLQRDKKSWDTFVNRYNRLISHAIVKTLNRYSFTPKGHIVDDLFQTVFLSLIEHNCKKLRQFQWKCKLSGWLHVIAVRATVDYLRKQSEHLSLDGETDEEIHIKEKVANGNPLPGELIELKEEKKIFEQIKESLTSKERLFIELYYARELSSTEVAKIMNTTSNNVYQLKNRVREKMKNMVEDYL